MPIGDPVRIYKLNEELELELCYESHILKSNKTRSAATFEAGGEQDAALITFTLRWSKHISPIEYEMSSYRLKWRGHLFDIIGYDDYMYQHRKVDLSCRSVEGGAYD